MATCLRYSSVWNDVPHEVVDFLISHLPVNNWLLDADLTTKQAFAVSTEAKVDLTHLVSISDRIIEMNEEDWNYYGQHVAQAVWALK